MTPGGEPPAPGPLRHGRSLVGVSTLASQWYCELKIELRHRHPEIRFHSAALDLGTDAHERLSAGATVITRAEFEKDVAAGNDLVLQESRFQAEIDGVPVVGVPDLVRLRGRRCDLVLEMKFSKRSALYLDRFIQAQSYGLLLSRNGFELDRTPCVVGVVRAPLAGERDEKLRTLKESGILHAILDRCRELRDREPLGWKSRGVENPVTLQEGPVTLQAFPFREAAVLPHLRWAFDFWKSKREPLASSSAAKCRACPYNAAGVCDQARGAPDRAFRVRKLRENGADVLEVALDRGAW